MNFFLDRINQPGRRQLRRDAIDATLRYFEFSNFQNLNNTNKVLITWCSVIIITETADRAKEIRTKATVNENTSEKILKDLQEENQRLKAMLAENMNSTQRPTDDKGTCHTS